MRSVRSQAAQTPFEVRRRLNLWLILPHVNYGNIVFTGADSASQRRLRVAFKTCLRYIHIRRRFDYVSHLELTVTGTLLVDNIYTSYCIFVILLISFASSCTRNLTVPLHSTLAIYESVIGGFGLTNSHYCQFLSRSEGVELEAPIIDAF
jgi:hypothetical protein